MANVNFRDIATDEESVFDGLDWRDLGHASIKHALIPVTYSVIHIQASTFREWTDDYLNVPSIYPREKRSLERILWATECMTEVRLVQHSGIIQTALALNLFDGHGQIGWNLQWPATICGSLKNALFLTWRYLESFYDTSQVTFLAEMT